MRIKLSVFRYHWPKASILWSISDEDLSPGTTISFLLSKINEIIPLEAANWGLEDYVVELDGFECLHFQQLSAVIKDGDHLVIRPLRTPEVRARALSGRHQINAGGQKLIDGIAYGRAYLRTPSRPEVNIPPRRTPHSHLNPSVNPSQLAITYPLISGRKFKRKAHFEDQAGQTFSISRKRRRRGSLSLDRDSPVDEDDDDEDDDYFEPESQDLATLDPTEVEDLDDEVAYLLKDASMDLDEGSENDSQDDDFDLDEYASEDEEDENSSEEEEGGDDDGDEAGDDNNKDENKDDENSDNDMNSQQSNSDSDSEVDDTATSITAKRTKSAKDMKANGVAQHTSASASGSSADSDSSSISSDSESSSSSDSSSDSSSHGASESDSHSDSDLDSAPRHSARTSNQPTSVVTPGIDSKSVSNNTTVSAASESNSSSTVLRSAAIATVAPGKGKLETRNRNARRRVSKKLQAQKNNRDPVVSVLEPNLQAKQEKKPTDVALVFATVGEGHNEAADSDVQDSNPTSKRSLDVNSSKRLIFGALGVRTPKTKEQEQELRQRLMSRPKKPDLEAEATKPVPICEEQPASVAWKTKMSLSALECDPDYGVGPYPPPPYPFSQWEDQETDENHPSHQFNDAQDKLPEESKDAIAGEFNGNGTENFLSAEMNTHISQTAGNSTSKQAKGAILPELPHDPDTLPDAMGSDLRPGAVIAFTQFELGSADNWGPAISKFKMARIDDVPEKDVFRLTLAQRDLAISKPNFHDKMPRGLQLMMQEDHDEEEDTGLRIMNREEFVALKLVTPAPTDAGTGSDQTSNAPLPDNSSENHAANRESPTQEGDIMQVVPVEQGGLDDEDAVSLGDSCDSSWEPSDGEK